MDSVTKLRTQLLVEGAVMRLLATEPWYGTLLASLSYTFVDIPPDEKGFPRATAAVHKSAKRKYGCAMMINAAYFTPMSGRARIHLLKHEILHLVFKHLSSWDTFEDKQRLQIAADLDVNSWLERDNIGICPYVTSEDRDLLRKEMRWSPETEERLKQDASIGVTYGWYPSYFGFDSKLTFHEYYELLPPTPKVYIKLIGDQDMIDAIKAMMEDGLEEAPDGEGAGQEVEIFVGDRLENLFRSQHRMRGLMPA